MERAKSAEMSAGDVAVVVLALRQPEVLQALEDLLESNPSLQPREGRADAEMQAVAKPEMHPQVLARTLDVETLRLREALTDAGWTYSNGKLGKNGQRLSFGFLGRASHNSGPEYLVKQWTEMGADVKLFVLDNTSFSQNLTAGNFDVSIVAGVVPTPIIAPAAQRISGPAPPKGTNNSRTFDPILDSEAAAAAQSSGAESCKHWATFQEELWKKWHLLPLDTAYTGFFTRNVDLTRAVSTGARPPIAILARRYAP